MAQRSGSIPAAFDFFLQLARDKGIAYETQVRNALGTLCQGGYKAGKGFDPNVLSLLLRLLVIVPHAKRSGWNPKLELLRYGNGNKHRFTHRDLRRITERAQQLGEDVRKLKRTNLVFYLYSLGQIPPGDLLDLQFTDDRQFIDEVPVALNTLVKFNIVASQASASYLRGPDGSLLTLCRYIKRTTGSWNDALLVDILQPFQVPHTNSLDALKMWRSRQVTEIARNVVEIRDSR
jgi:hypothetical protein